MSYEVWRCAVVAAIGFGAVAGCAVEGSESGGDGELGALQRALFVCDETTPLASYHWGAAIETLGVSEDFDGVTFGSGTTVQTLAREDLSYLHRRTGLGGNINGTSQPLKLADGTLAEFFPLDSGVLHSIRIDPLTGWVTDYWVRSLRRGGCPDDKIAAPLVLRRAFASADFKARFATDMIYSGTRNGIACGGEVSLNRVYAMNADTGGTEWIFNDTGHYEMNHVKGSVIDAGADTLFVTTERDMPSQNTVWAISTVNGALRWASNEGRIWVPPVLRGDRIYVATLTGKLTALDKADGSTIWSLPVLPSGLPIVVPIAANPDGSRIAVADLFGRIWVANDNGGSASWAWDDTLPGGARPTFMVFGPSLYVGADDGKLYELDPDDGELRLTRTVGQSSVTQIALDWPDDADDLLTLVAAGAGGAVVRYCLEGNP